jgi:hypothetical protein
MGAAHCNERQITKRYVRSALYSNDVVVPVRFSRVGNFDIAGISAMRFEHDRILLAHPGMRRYRKLLLIRPRKNAEGNRSGAPFVVKNVDCVGDRCEIPSGTDGVFTRERLCKYRYVHQWYRIENRTHDHA